VHQISAAVAAGRNRSVLEGEKAKDASTSTLAPPTNQTCPVVQINRDGSRTTHSSMGAANRATGITRVNLRNALYGKRPLIVSASPPPLSCVLLEECLTSTSIGSVRVVIRNGRGLGLGLGSRSVRFNHVQTFTFPCVYFHLLRQR
jgi:hypothetical protein